MSKFTFSSGNMWEGGPWEIEKDFECSELGGGEPCQHCHDIKIKTNKRSDGTEWEEKIWICNLVIVVKNEGGFNTTGLCAECALEAINKIKNA